MKFGFVSNKKIVDRRAIPLLIALLSLLLVLCFVFSGCEEEPTMDFEDLYNDAVALMEEGKYEEAIAAFEGLDGYKDSNEKIENCKNAISEKSYNSAIDMLEDGRYEQAIEAFESLDGYKESEKYISECRAAITERDYNRATSLMESDEYAEALTIFSTLGEYKDSAKLADECRIYSSFVFELNSTNNSYTVSAYTGNDEKITIPEKYKGLPITVIGDDAFNRCEKLIEVIIPDSVVSIGRGAFAYCNELKKVNIAELCESIGERAFFACESLVSVTLPNEIKDIGDEAFAGCIDIQSITFVGSEEEWNSVLLGDEWNTCNSPTGETVNISVEFKPECDGENHYAVIDAAVAPTCTETGLSEGSHCSVCNAVIIEQTVVGALGHDTTEHEAQSATCLEIGWEKYETCSRCDHSTFKVIDALGHDLTEIAAQEASCTEDGWNAYTECSRCDYTTFESVAALGHDSVEYSSCEPSCTEIGWEAYEACSRCSYSTYAEISATGHDIIDHEAVSPKCSEPGCEAYQTCSKCEYTTYTEIPARGHTISFYSAKAPTCTSVGWDAYKECNDCDFTTYAEIPVLDHTLTRFEAKEPTCTEIGWNEYEKCSECGYNTYVEIPALKHDLESCAAKSATCTESGWETYEKCSRCDYSTFVEIGALSHDIKQYAAQEPSCDRVGWDSYEACSRCGYTTYNEIGMLDHTIDQYEAWEPTCTENGWNAYEKCSKCSYTTYVEIEKLGHDTVLHEAQKVTCISDGWDAYETCTRCDYSTFVRVSANDDAHDVNKENTCVICLKYFDSGVVFSLSDDEGHYVVTDYTGDAERVVIPSEYKGVEVTAIGDSAFADSKSVKTLVITGNIVFIGENAFAGSAIEQIKYTGSESEWSNIEKSQETLMGIEIILDYDFKEGEVRFHFINVGQGDAILVTTPWGNMLIDSGDLGSTSRNALVNYLAEYGVSSFEYVIFTHPDADHIGSADYILLNYDVENVIMPDCDASTQVYKRLLDAIDTTGVNLILIGENAEYCKQPGYTFEIGALVNTVLAPIEKDSNSNDMSVVVKSEFGEISVLFTGDAEKDEEGDMLAAYRNGELDCDILKVGHHGSSTSTTAEFLEAVSPEIAVISCGLDNKFGHPHSEIVSRLESVGVEYYRTDIVGDVVIWTDGSKIEVAA